MANIQFNLRVPQELKDRIEEAAKRTGRSINAEAAYRLDRGLRPQVRPPDYITGYYRDAEMGHDDSFYERTGLTEEDIGKYIIKVIEKNLQDTAHKKDK